MKKISFLLSLVLVLALAAPSFAADVEFSGASYFIFDEFTEIDGKQEYSMNGNTNIFGTGDWKKSTTDNPNDNREKFQNKLVLNMTANVNQNLKVDMGFESLVDEFIGYPNGTGATRVQEAPTVRDNPPVRLKDLKVTADTEEAKIVVTNNFNYNFNSRVLATQFEDNWGEMNPYGEGVLVETDLAGVATKGFVFQATETTTGPASSAGDDIIVDNNDRMKAADNLVYGADFKKELDRGKVGALIVNTHDKSTDENTSSDFDQDKDILRAAVNGEYRINDMITINGEVITAQYGDDVTKVINVLNTPYPADDDDNPNDANFDVGNKEDTEILEVGTKLNPMPGLEVNLGYKDVGEDYIATVGADHSMDSWYGDASFNAGDGTGYDKGFSLSTNYQLPVLLTPTATLEFTDYDQTRSAFNDNEDTNEQEIEASIATSQGPWSAEASYRIKEETNSGADYVVGDDNTAAERDIVYNDFNINGSYKVIDSEKLTTNLHGDLNYYVGDDETINQNFSTEKRVKVGAGNTYKLNDKVTLTGSYDYGYATEDNDVFEDASGRQHLVKLGASYKVSENTTFDVLYKYDNYNLDRKVTDADALVNSVYKKEAEHQWYDGGESWEHSGYAWNNGPTIKNVAPTYSGYTTHEVKATLTVNF
ncbi:autotransporter [Halanaerobacter jeridensis]|uniref:Uncharacterized protein n=1 Tax=Halanaerobacter jeridensis TaxID=706427 RepID=A0A938XNG1_9FIRM|nr:autotransporter [Halanaerobacter jeridensis]MBM7555688.1 hypothetical protein [Halanaerobacter jeridensis]